jgi:hypothetical protein
VDFILWFPFPQLFQHLNEDIGRVYIIKCYRLYRVLQIFNVNTIVKHYKERHRKKIEKLVFNDIESEQDIAVDFNQISFKAYVRYSL